MRDNFEVKEPIRVEYKDLLQLTISILQDLEQADQVDSDFAGFFQEAQNMLVKTMDQYLEEEIGDFEMGKCIGSIGAQINVFFKINQ